MWMQGWGWVNEESWGGCCVGAKQEWRYFSKCHGTIVDKKTSLVAELKEMKSLCQSLGGTTHLNWGGGLSKRLSNFIIVFGV